VTAPATIEEVSAFVRDCPPGARILSRGNGTKPALSTPPVPNCQLLITSNLAGVLEYEPSEFTFTALAGTPVREVNALLAGHGQYLPFDPPLAARGATLGGTIAAGLSGPSRYRYGGARDFLIGARFVDAAGRLVRGGSKVVKNAAGFDLPKLMVGSLGGYGPLVELTFKVFPRPEAFVTVRLECAAREAVDAIRRLYGSQLDVDALDYAAGAPGALWVRLGGLASVLPPRAERLRGLLGGGDALAGADEAGVWEEAREFQWVPAGWALLKVPLNPGKIAQVEEALAGRGALRRYSAGGQVLWLASLESAPALDALLREQGLSALMLWGAGPQAPHPARLGVRTGESFARRVKQALDPDDRFVTRHAA
jgi:glycolate oxidase FAD binding subunit